MKSSNAAKIGRAVWVLAGLMLGGPFGKAGTGLAAEYTWAQKVDMPTARMLHSTSVVDGKIYVIGGSDSEPGYDPILAVEVYDPSMDSWTRKADLPTARMIHSASVVNGKIYVVGGYKTYDSGVLLSTVQEYDPVTDTWTRKADLPTPRRAALATSVVDGKIYAIGGFTGAQGVNTVEVYDPVTDTWTRKAANFPFGVWGLCTAVVDGKIYALGGRYASAISYVQQYDPATDTWTRKSDIPVATGQMGSVVLGGKIFVIGGWLNSGNHPYTAVQMYDPETDIWTIEGDAPFRRAAFSASVVNNRIYVIGGTDRPHPCPATSTVYELTVGPPPDLNSDDRVDIDDLIILIEHWGQNEPAYDMGPTPWGDGVIDATDLEVLMSHWGQDAHFIAHWKLDETGGDVAYDSVDENHAAVMGDPIWQRQSGHVNGAIQFDGVDDYVQTDFLIDPSKGPLSVYAWVKGDTPGQAIVSQEMAIPTFDSVWLGTDPIDGRLVTSHMYPMVSQLESNVVITDDQWHHVGLVWDGTHRYLYVDDEEVAVDEELFKHLASSRGLHIGADSHLQPGAFWSGMIDDVRIYDRAVEP